MPRPASPHQHQLFVDIVEQTDELAFFLLDLTGTISWHNRAAALLFNHDDLAGASAAELFLEDDRRRGIPDHERDVAHASGVARDDRWMRRADGSRFWASGAMVALRGPDRTVRCYAKFLRDGTDLRMRIEEADNRARAAEARIAQQQLEIRKLAHELRNPLAVIGAAAGVLSHSAMPDKRRKDVISRIERQISFMAELISRMNEGAAGTQGSPELEHTSFQLRSLLENAIGTVCDGRTGARERIEVLMPASEQVFHGDPVRLEQILVNLLENALKFTPVPGRIWLNAAAGDAELVLRVRDEGIGIAPEMIEKIFEAFTRVASRPTDAGSASGIGLGLAVVREITRLHGGTVQAKSRGIGHGAEFTVRLPQAHGMPASAHQHDAQPDEAKPEQ